VPLMVTRGWWGGVGGVIGENDRHSEKYHVKPGVLGGLLYGGGRVVWSVCVVSGRV
jgi:hypothetical protein